MPNIWSLPRVFCRKRTCYPSLPYHCITFHILSTTLHIAHPNSPPPLAKDPGHSPMCWTHSKQAVVKANMFCVQEAQDNSSGHSVRKHISSMFLLCKSYLKCFKSYKTQGCLWSEIILCFSMSNKPSSRVLRKKPTAPGQRDKSHHLGRCCKHHPGQKGGKKRLGQNTRSKHNQTTSDGIIVGPGVQITFLGRSHKNNASHVIAFSWNMHPPQCWNRQQPQLAHRHFSKNTSLLSLLLIVNSKGIASKHVHSNYIKR